MTAATLAPEILYIDDEALLCRVFQRIFDGQGVRIVTFTDPELGLAYAHAHPIAAIVCDYRMPTLNGLDVLARLQRDIPFILVSGDIAIASLVEHNPRVTHVLSKPFQPEALLALLRPYVTSTTRG